MASDLAYEYELVIIPINLHSSRVASIRGKSMAIYTRNQLVFHNERTLFRVAPTEEITTPSHRSILFLL